jgi:anti-sigma factor RsiW
MNSRIDKDCRYSEEELELYFDDALPQEEKLLICRHAEGCSVCSAYLKDMASLRKTVKEQFTTGADEKFSREIMEKIHLRPLPLKSSPSGVLHKVIDLLLYLPQSNRVVATLAASFLVIVLAVFLKYGFIPESQKAGICLVDSVYAPKGNAFVFNAEDNVKVVWVFEGDIKL